ncbi:BON domain-containing protein [Thaumasiovibrio subtropicus]|uniref:BON domain-containing protein n=1 Tax=Thaumasiovibrio subtropicus TaxID=1891207 RepID=UPI000B35447D|nr:BON domain-containing protein [Thaumasiovibrio subtropicus]
MSNRWVRGVLLMLAIAIVGCVQHRDINSHWQDKQIEMDVAGIANKPPFRGALRINAIAYEGELFLAGQAPDALLLTQFVAEVEQIDGVSQLYNQVRSRALADFSTASRDTWITGRIKSMILADTTIENDAVKVMTEAQEVFLIGSLTQPQMTTLVDKVRHIDGVREVFTVIHSR